MATSAWQVLQPRPCGGTGTGAPSGCGCAGSKGAGVPSLMRRSCDLRWLEGIPPLKQDRTGALSTLVLPVPLPNPTPGTGLQDLAPALPFQRPPRSPDPPIPRAGSPGAYLGPGRPPGFLSSLKEAFPTHPLPHSSPAGVQNDPVTCSRTVSTAGRDSVMFITALGPGDQPVRTQSASYLGPAPHVFLPRPTRACPVGCAPLPTACHTRVGSVREPPSPGCATPMSLGWAFGEG